MRFVSGSPLERRLGEQSLNQSGVPIIGLTLGVALGGAIRQLRRLTGMNSATAELLITQTARNWKTC
jgi:hypothetical protein